MIEIKGKNNTAKVFTDNIDAIAQKQIEELCDMEAYSDSRIRIMPDVHAGAGCTIGTTMTLHGIVTPNLVGVDIGCGMETIMIKEKEIDFKKLDNLIREQIPSGQDVRDNMHPNAYKTKVFDLRITDKKEHLEKELKSIGTLGGGNHFIEVDKDDEGNLYVVVHSGSRHLGKEVADKYQTLAFKQMSGSTDEEIRKAIEELKAKGRKTEIESTIKKLHEGVNLDIKKELTYLKGELFDDYIRDMKIMQGFADINRKTMMEIIVEGMGLTIVEQFTTIHNYIDTDNMILRKGSVSAQKGEKILIPINMRDGSLICIGKGNPDWNYSAPHGAGRILSRKESRNTLSVEEFKKQMEGIYSTTVNETTLDESPMAYKDMTDIVNNIEPTAEIIKIIKPIYNFKASE